VSYNTIPESTKTKVVYIILPKTITVIDAKPKTDRFRKAANNHVLISFEDSLKSKMATFYYELPSKGIALEEYTDYLVVNVGITAPENRFKKVTHIALEKERGLILKPPRNPAQLYLMDRIVLQYNDLGGFESRRY